MIVFIIVQKLKNGGAERTASNLSIELSRLYDVKLILFDSTGITYPYGGDLISLDCPPGKTMASKFFNIFRRVKKVKKLKKQYNPCVSISLLFNANLINVFSSSGEKTIISIRNNLSESHLSKFDIFMERITFKKADKIVALSKAVELDLYNNFYKCNKYLTIYNYVDSKQLLFSSESIDFQCEYIVSMGRLTIQKGQWHLIKAFKSFSDKHKNINLVVLGKGEMEEKLKELIAFHHLEDRVRLCGFITNPHYIIKKAKFFVFTSLYEGLGNVLLEALSMGKLVVSTDCHDGPREILDDEVKTTSLDKPLFAKYGILFPEFENIDDSDNFEITQKEVELGELMSECCNQDLIHNYSMRAYKRANDFSKDKIISEWIKVIEEQ